MNQIDKHY